IRLGSLLPSPFSDELLTLSCKNRLYHRPLIWTALHFHSLECTPCKRIVVELSFYIITFYQKFLFAYFFNFFIFVIITTLYIELSNSISFPYFFGTFFYIVIDTSIL